MELEKFKKLIKKNKITVIDEQVQTRAIIKKYEETEFNCEIKKYPISCKTTRKVDPQQYWISKDMLCCFDCESRIGFLRYINRKSLKQIAKKFSNKTGFWRKDKGCILPISQRSSTCLAYCCGCGENKKIAVLKQKLQNQEYKLREKYQ